MSHQQTPEPTRRTRGGSFSADDPRWAPHERTVRPSTWWRGPSLWIVLPFAAYLVLVLLGVTQSSIGIAGLREDPAAPTGVMIGSAEPIRTDEYLTSTPLAIGVTATGDAEDLNPLTGPQGFSTLFPSTPVSSVVLFDGAILRAGTFLPDQMLVAARWWLPFLLLFLGAPAFFRTLTGSRGIGLFAAVLIVGSPASAWWSFSPLGVLGFTLAGAAALQRCAGELAGARRLWRVVGWGLLAAILLARTPLHYQPWAIVVAPVILLAAIVPLVADRVHRGAHLIAVGAVGALSLLLAGLVFVENRGSIQASLDTIYPGSRVSSGSANPFQEIFGGTSLGWLKNTTVVATNHSEISSSFTVAAVWVVLLVAYGLRYRDRMQRVAVISAGALTAFWFAWSMVDFGTLGSRVSVLNLVPSGRASDMLGYLAVLLACLVLPALPAGARRGFALLAAGTTALVSAYAGSLLRAQNLPDLSVRHIWFAALFLAVVIFVLTSWPRRWYGYVAAGLGAFLLVWHVNPILFGLADLRGSAIAKQLLAEGAQARADGGLWASDDLYVDSLLTATGVPALSGRQLSGPDVDAWSELDPGRQNEVVWNRGGSFITYEWTDAPTLTFANTSPDVIHVSGSPCALAERMPALTTIVSSSELDLGCLTQVDDFTWGGNPKWVYEVDAAAATEQ